jgi:mono/diheme cytochrome c family protein
MNGLLRSLPLLVCSGVLLACGGCWRAPGIPAPGDDVPRPDKQLDFHALYKQNCAGCHGENGVGGAAVRLNNAAYLAVAGPDNLRGIVAKGMASTLMPGFGAGSGGMLTDQQVNALVEGMLNDWSRPEEFRAVALPPYSSSSAGNPAGGREAYVTACARCHGADGTGVHPAPGQQQPPGSSPHSIVDPSYLSLVSDQSLRTIVIAGHPDDHAPDWRSYIPGRALDPQQISDIVAWIASHRASAAQQSSNRSASSSSGAAPGAAVKERR